MKIKMRRGAHNQHYYDLQHATVKCYATSWKVTGSRPDEVNDFYQFT
jgi:hypothetical protein